MIGAKTNATLEEPILARSWPAGRPRILVSDAWLANGGDGAIALATERRLRRLVPTAAILHGAYQGDLLAHAYPELDLVPPLSGLLGVSGIPEMHGWDAQAAEQIVGAADVVLSQGGGFAMEHYDPGQRLRAWEIVVERGIPIAFCAQSVGVWRAPLERETLGRVYGAAAAVGLREPDSIAHVIDVGAPRERIVLGADETFSLFRAPDRRPAPGRGFACVLSGHPWLREDGAIVEPAASLDTLADLVAHLVELADGEHVTLLSTQQGLGGGDRSFEDDSELARRVVDLLPQRISRAVRTVAGYIAPLRCADLIATHRAVVAMRMHPAIFGLCRRVPTVLLTGAFKAISMFEMLDLAEGLLRSGEPWSAIDAKLVVPPAAKIEAARRRAAANDEVVWRLLDAWRELGAARANG